LENGPLRCIARDGKRARSAPADQLEAQADKFFKECIEIADAATQENCNVARLRVDTRKWAAARLAPKKYSDHITHDVKGRGINFQPQILIQCSRDEGEGIH
jgi:hypothetical protein